MGSAVAGVFIRSISLQLSWQMSSVTFPYRISTRLLHTWLAPTVVYLLLRKPWKVSGRRKVAAFPLGLICPPGLSGGRGRGTVSGLRGLHKGLRRLGEWSLESWLGLV